MKLFFLLLICAGIFNDAFTQGIAIGNNPATPIRAANSATIATPRKGQLMTFASIGYYILDVNSVEVYTEETDDGPKDIPFSFVIYKF